MKLMKLDCSGRGSRCRCRRVCVMLLLSLLLQQLRLCCINSNRPCVVSLFPVNRNIAETMVITMIMMMMVTMLTTVMPPEVRHARLDLLEAPYPAHRC